MRLFLIFFGVTLTVYSITQIAITAETKSEFIQSTLKAHFKSEGDALKKEKVDVFYSAYTAGLIFKLKYVEGITQIPKARKEFVKNHPATNKPEAYNSINKEMEVSQDGAKARILFQDSLVKPFRKEVQKGWEFVTSVRYLGAFKEANNYVPVYLMIDFKTPEQFNPEYKKFFEACNKSDGESCARLALLKDSAGKSDEAMPLFKKACDNKNYLSCVEYGFLAAQSGDHASELKYYQIACDNQEPKGCINLSIQEGMKKNFEKAKQLTLGCCNDLKSAMCCRAVGEALVQLKDPVSAKEYFAMACKLGQKEACSR